MTTKELYHHMRRNGCAPGPKFLRLSDVHYAINERANAARAIAGKVENGKIAIHVSGMDCDCTSYSYGRVIDAPTSLVRFVQEANAHAESLDGPETTRYGKPSDMEEPYRRSIDLALEAYENGSMHHVMYRAA